MPAGSLLKRRHQAGHTDISMLGHEQARTNAFGQRRLDVPRRVPVEIGVRHARAGKDPRGLFELPGLAVGTRDLQRAQAPVLDGALRVGGDTSNEAVVPIEATETEPEQVG